MAMQINSSHSVLLLGIAVRRLYRCSLSLLSSIFIVMFSSLLQRAGFKPGLALHSTIPKVLIAATVVSGAVSLLAPGSARATTWVSTCSFTFLQTECKGPSGTGWTTNPAGPPAPSVVPLQLGDKVINIGNYDFNTSLGGVFVKAQGEFQYTWQDGDTPTFGDDTWAFRVSFLSPGVVGKLGTNATGSIDYTLNIVDSTATFRDIRVDSAVTSEFASVTTCVATFGCPLFISVDGGNSGYIPLSGTSLSVTNTYEADNVSGLQGFNNGFRQNANDVPGPLPLMGAGMAFGFSRKLRSRIKTSARAKA